MFCKNCGAEIDDKAVVCPKCGVAQSNTPTASPDDKPSAGFAVLCFFIPIVGLILYLIWHDTYPLKARSCGKGALIGVIVSVVSVIFLYAVASCVLIGAASTLQV